MHSLCGSESTPPSSVTNISHVGFRETEKSVKALSFFSASETKPVFKDQSQVCRFMTGYDASSLLQVTARRAASYSVHGFHSPNWTTRLSHPAQQVGVEKRQNIEPRPRSAGFEAKASVKCIRTRGGFKREGGTKLGHQRD